MCQVKPRNHVYFNANKDQDENNNNNNNKTEETHLGNSVITPRSKSNALPSSPSSSTPPAAPFTHSECHVTHIVSNGKFLCFQLFDTTGLPYDILSHCLMVTYLLF